MIQIILGLIIIMIGGFVFYKYPFKSDIKEMALAASFIVIAIILKRFSIMVPFLGFPSLKITLEVLPLILAGLVLSPTYSFIVAILTDFLGLVFADAGGYPFFGFTLNAIIQTLAPCFIKMYIKDLNPKLVARVLKGFMVVLGVVSSIYIVLLDKVVINKQTFEITGPMKAAIIAIIVIVITVIFIVMLYYQNKLSNEQLHNVNIVITTVIFIELIVNFVLTPYWLQTMYSIPFLASSFVRIIKACLMIPISVVIVYTIYTAIEKQLK